MRDLQRALHDLVRRVPRFLAADEICAALFAFIGLVFLTGNGFAAIQLSFGQTLTLLGSIAIALEIILISYFAEQVNVRRVTVLQLIFASLFCFMIAPVLGESQLPEFHWHLAGILVGLGIASAMIQLVMNWAQRRVDASQAAIIYAGEPVWAALFGRLAGERLPALALLGGLMIGIVQSVMSTLWPEGARLMIYVAMAAVLLLRPHGLLGRKE